MEQKKYTKHSAESSVIHDRPLPSLDFELPVGEGLSRVPPRVSIPRMMEHNRKLREMFPHGLPTAKERWDAKRGEAFRL